MRKEIFETTWIISMFLTIDNHGYKRLPTGKLAIVWLKDKKQLGLYIPMLSRCHRAILKETDAENTKIYVK